MRNFLKKATAVFVAAAIAFTPIVVNADESFLADAKARGLQHLELYVELGSDFSIALTHSGYDHIWAYTAGDATAETLFNIHSATTIFTAIAIMQLVERGMIDLDAPVVNYLPGFSIMPHPSLGGDYRNITTRMLLAHTSGLPVANYSGLYTVGENHPGFMNNLLENLAQVHMERAEMTRMTYSGVGYNLLGMLVAEVSGYAEDGDFFNGFMEYLQANIISPLGMDSTVFTSSTMAFYNSPATGGLYSNIHDMTRFMQMLLNGGSFDGANILSPEYLAQMIIPQDIDFWHYPVHQFGLGLAQVATEHGTMLIGHDGRWLGGGNMIDGASSAMLLDFEQGLGVFVSANGAAGATAASRVAGDIAFYTLYELTGIDDSIPLAPPSQPTELPIYELERLVGRFTIMGDVRVSDDGVLYSISEFFDETVVFTPYIDGSFGYSRGDRRFFFDEIAGERVLLHSNRLHIADMYYTPWQADESFNRWTGIWSYHADVPHCFFNLFDLQMIVGVDEDGYAFTLSAEGMSRIVGRADDYTFYLTTTVGSAGALIHFSIDEDGTKWLTSMGTRYVQEGQEAEPTAAASSEIRFVIGSTEFTHNGTSHQMESVPFLDNEYNRTMIPLHIVAEIFGAEVGWIEETQTATIMFGEVSLAVSAVEPLPHGLGMAHNIDGRIFVPLRYIADAFGVQVSWDNDNQAAYVF